MIAPLVSLVVQIWLVYTLIDNLATLGGTNGFAQSIPYVGLAIIIVGLIWGFVLSRPIQRPTRTLAIWCTKASNLSPVDESEDSGFTAVLFSFVVRTS